LPAAATGGFDRLIVVGWMPTLRGAACYDNGPDRGADPEQAADRHGGRGRWPSSLPARRPTIPRGAAPASSGAVLPGAAALRPTTGQTATSPRGCSACRRAPLSGGQVPRRRKAAARLRLRTRRRG
jgi:hypothetical protein